MGLQICVVLYSPTGHRVAHMHTMNIKHTDTSSDQIRHRNMRGKLLVFYDRQKLMSREHSLI